MLDVSVSKESTTKTELVCSIPVAAKMDFFHPLGLRWHGPPAEILENPPFQERTTKFDIRLIKMDLALELYIPYTKIIYHCVH